MPCISGSYNRPAGVMFNVAVLPPSAGSEGLTLVAQTIQMFAALVDTGASVTCVSDKVVERVGLQPKGRATMISASERKDVNTYLFSLAIPVGIRPDPKGTFSGNMVAFPLLQGMAFHSDDGAFDVLLGMDIITQGSLKIDFDGHFSFCF